jgi:hypothetical protein
MKKDKLMEIASKHMQKKPMMKEPKMDKLEDAKKKFMCKIRGMKTK